jgi:hypothetical protein
MSIKHIVKGISVNPTHSNLVTLQRQAKQPACYCESLLRHKANQSQIRANQKQGERERERERERVEEKAMEKICVAVRVRPAAVSSEPLNGTFWRVEDNRISLHKVHGTPISGLSYAFGMHPLRSLPHIYLCIHICTYV